MDVTQLTMPVDEAREKFDTYRAALRTRHDALDAELCRAYEALAKGTPLIDINQAMGETGLQPNGLPCLAIASAAAAWVSFRHDWQGGGTFWWSIEPIARTVEPRSLAKKHVVPRETWGVPTGRLRLQQRAMVPHVPPELRPRYNLTGYHILFEAVWEPEAPIDPFLLKRVGPPGSSLYAILAHWDLTELERRVLASHVLRNNQ